MKLVLQRVTQASVTVNNEIVGTIGPGIMALLGIAPDDNSAVIRWSVDKLINLRIFEDSDHKMNLSLKDIQGSVLLVSQFTLYGDVRRGRRPGFTGAATPAVAEKLYEDFANALRNEGIHVETGIFGAMMQVTLTNDGPVTILLDREATGCDSH